MRTVGTIIVFLSIYLGIFFFIGWNGQAFLDAAFSVRHFALYWTLYTLLGFSYVAAMLLRRVLPYPIYVGLKLIGSYGMGVLFFSLLLFPIADLLVGGLYIGGVDFRQAVLIVGGVASAALVALLLRGSWNARTPVVRRYDLVIAKKAGARNGLRIMAASDLHLGNVVGRRHLAKLVRQAEALRPDIILLPGDVLDDSLEPFVRYRMAEVMKGLKAPLGVFAVLGNHEYFGGHISDYIERMKEIGINVLTDQTVLVDDSLYIVGRKDKAAERFDQAGRLPLAKLMEDVDRSLPIILLDHQPLELTQAAEAGVDLSLSGHTHRGQMAPNHWITRRMFELDWGYKAKGTLHAVVSSGFGTWGPPFRFGSRSEILDIRLTFAE